MGCKVGCKANEVNRTKLSLSLSGPLSSDAIFITCHVQLYVPGAVYRRILKILKKAESSLIDYSYGMRQKTLPCTVRFTLDRLMKTEVKRLLNGLRTDIERTTHGRGTTVHGPFRFTYVRTTRVLQLNFMRVQRKYLLWISNSASRLLVCNREVERDPVLKP